MDGPQTSAGVMRFILHNAFTYLCRCFVLLMVCLQTRPHKPNYFHKSTMSHMFMQNRKRQRNNVADNTNSDSMWNMTKIQSTCYADKSHSTTFQNIEQHRNWKYWRLVTPQHLNCASYICAYTFMSKCLWGLLTTIL